MIRSSIKSVLPWLICGLAAAFYCYEYLLRITPSLIIPELQRAFAADAKLVGYISACYYWAYTPMQLPVGVLLDRYGPRWILTIAVFCCAIGSLVFGVTESVMMASVGRFLIGFGSAFAFVGVLKLAAAWLPPDRFALISGLTTTLGMIGAMIGEVVLSEVIEEAGWRQTILYSSYVGFVLFPIMLLVIRDAPKEPNHANQAAANHNPSYRQLWQEIVCSLKNKQIWINGLVGGLIMAPTIVFAELWGKVYLQTVHNLSEHSATHTVSMVFLGWAVGGPMAGLISDKLKRRKSPIMVGSFIVILLLLTFLYTPGLSTIQLRLLLFFIGVGSSVEVICFAIGRENCPPNLAATAVAVTNFLVVSFSFLQVVVGYILDSTWDGMVLDQAKVYGVQSYHLAMSVLPISVFLAFLVSFFLKETFCQPIDAVNGEKTA